jgi:EAL domain
LKIDRSFLTPESFDSRSGLIITTIADLAHGLGMTVVAEGIETQDQIDRLAGLGCDLGQGYFIGEPKPAHEMTDILAVLPRYAAAPVSPEAPLTRRLTSLFDPPAEDLKDVEVLPSIFALQRTTKPEPKKKTKAKKPVKRARKN